MGTLQWCWRRPGLTALEVLWRWAFGIPALLLLRRQAERVLLAAPLDYGAVRGITLAGLVADPAGGSVTLARALAVVRGPVESAAVWVGPLLVVGWIAGSTLGRTLVLQSVDPALHRRIGTRFALQAIRIAALGLTFAAWCGCLQAAARVAIAGPVERGDQPSLVLYSALVIAATLGLFTLWAVGSWWLAVAPLIAMRRNAGAWASLRAAFGPRGARMQLVEINLVMGIVKIALLVLAMVFSASPLPFETVASREFLAWWWTGVTVLYLVASDFFHVARTVSYLGLLPPD